MVGKPRRARPAQCDAMVESVAEGARRILVLVTTRGITREQHGLRMKDAEWDEVIETNLRAWFRRVGRRAARHDEGAWGRTIINITSVVGSSGNPGQANYAAAKAGVVGMPSRSRARSAAATSR